MTLFMSMLRNAAMKQSQQDLLLLGIPPSSRRFGVSLSSTLEKKNPKFRSKPP